MDDLSDASEWLREMWIDARETRREAIWRMLPESILDRLESSPDFSVSPADVDFLFDVAKNSQNECRVAIRLISFLVEEGRLPPERVVPLLASLLDDPSPAVRYQAVEAFWTISDKSQRDVLIRARNRETHLEIVKILDHVIWIFS